MGTNKYMSNTITDNKDHINTKYANNANANTGIDTESIDKMVTYNKTKINNKTNTNNTTYEKFSTNNGE